MKQWVWNRIIALLAVLAMLCAGIPAALAAQEEIPDLTLAELEAMNDGQLAYTTDANGNITFLRGRFCAEKVTDLDSAVRALGGVLLLLGGDEHTAFSKAVGMEDDYGNRYYTLYQWSGDTAVQNAVVKIITDPEGNTIALSSSLVPGKADQPDVIIKPEAALALAKEHLAKSEPDKRYTFFEDTVDTSIILVPDASVDNSIMTLVYIVYTNNPNSSVETNDLPYLAHYVARSGKYLYSMPVSTRGNELAKAGSDPLRKFDGMTSDTYTGAVTLHDGTTREITVPVMKDANGTYYLGDLERHIAMADCWEFMYNDVNVVLSSTPDNTGWDNKQLISYEGYIQAYDYYAAVGWKSTDGLGTPILLLADYVEMDKEPVNNACYIGKTAGWQCFAATSELNNYCEALDAIGHEYTHGFTTASMTAIRYENQYGAINESLSDIMGNIMEMLCGRTEDMTWGLAEATGTMMRCMTDPNRYNQPAYVGDLFYVPDAAVPGVANDRGGVHINNSLLCVVATKLWQAGMTLEEARALWTTFICGLVPSSGYKDVCQMLPFAATLAGLDAYQDDIAKALSEIGLDNPNPFGTLKEGCGLLTMEIPEGIDPNATTFTLRDQSGSLIRTYPSAETGAIAILLRAGEYEMRMKPADDSGDAYYFTGEKWINDSQQSSKLMIVAGETFAVPTLIETVALPEETAQVVDTQATVPPTESAE